jgi:hypothetical protein
MVWLIFYLMASSPFSQRVARLSNWPDHGQPIALEVFSGVVLLLLGPLLWLLWLREAQP